MNLRQRQTLQDYINRDKRAEEREEAYFIAWCCVAVAAIIAITYWGAK